MRQLFGKIGYNLSRFTQEYRPMKKLEIHTFDDALQMAMECIAGTQKREIVMLDAALGHSIATDIICQKNLPSFDNSAMDGFALRAEDAGKQLRIVATIFAGDTPKAILEEGCCYKIMTGAQVPSDADTIVPIEECSDVTAESVVVPDGLKKGSALRKRGEEQTKGSVLIEAGERLDFSHIAMLSAQGIVAVEVYTPLTIAVVSTGDEIREPWQEASEDEIYNANAFGITALLKKYGFSPTYIGSIPDDLQKSIAFISSLKCYDVVITTGGISMGEADFLEEAFVANGLEVLFHGVNVKPGRPTMMGKMGESGETFVMAMPGNPMTTLLNIFLLSIPILRKLQGNSNPRHPAIKAPISQTLRFKPSRTNLVLGQMREGVFHVTRDNKIGSGMLTPLMESNAVAVFGEGLGEVSEGDQIEVILF
jgi:molybdopterin molybdotransferase